jgi:hypothetical protein
MQYLIKRHYSSSDKIPDTRLGWGKVVYLAQRADGAIKIGISANPRDRMKNLEKASGVPFVYIYLSRPFGNPGRVEKVLHQRYSNSRMLGEWFKVNPTEAAGILLAFEKTRDRDNYAVIPASDSGVL